jgi:hypothetical protein
MIKTLREQQQKEMENLKNKVQDLDERINEKIKELECLKIQYPLLAETIDNILQWLFGSGNVTPENQGEYLKCSECEQTIWLTSRTREDMTSKQKNHEIQYVCQECSFFIDQIIELEKKLEAEDKDFNERKRIY